MVAPARNQKIHSYLKGLGIRPRVAPTPWTVLGYAHDTSCRPASPAVA